MQLKTGGNGKVSRQIQFAPSGKDEPEMSVWRESSSKSGQALTAQV